MNNGIADLGKCGWPPRLPYSLPGSPSPVRMIDDRCYDADALRYILAVESKDGRQLELDVRVAINNFVIGCKEDGIWSAIKASCILMGARTLSGALTPLAGTAPTNFNFVSGDYNRKTGLVGNGTSKYINSGRNNSADPQNNNHMAVYVSTAASSGATFPVYVGAGGGVAGATHFGRLNANGNLFFRNRNDTFSTASAGSGTATGFIGMSRSGSANYVRRISGSDATVTQTSQSPLPQNVFVFASSADSGSGAASLTYSNARIAFYSCGESLSLSLLDSRLVSLYNAIGAAIP